MKRLLTLIFVMVLALSVLAGCKGISTSGTTTSSTTTSSTTAPVDEDLQAAYDYIKLTYKTLGVTPVNFDLMKGAPIGDKLFPITWSVDNDAITITEGDEFYVVNIPELGAEAINYTLSFSIQNEVGEIKEGSFNLTVPAFAINTYAEYAAAEANTMLTIRGIVTAIVSPTTGSLANGLYLQDLNGEGGYYVYGLAEDPYGTFEIGMTVEASGAKAFYNGNHQLANATVTVIDETINPVTPVDYTELFKNAPALNDESLVYKQAMLVTIKGVTVLEKQDKYYYFELGGHKTYVYISSSNNPTSSEALETIKANHEANYYNAADVTGIIGLYGGELTLYPVSADCFSNFTVLEKPDSFKVEQAMKDKLVSSIIQTAGTINLPAQTSTFSVPVTWELLDGAGVATLTENALAITLPETAKTVTLKATYTLNETVASKEFTITVKDIETITIKDVDNIVAGFVKDQYTDELFYVVGTIEQISNTNYGNMYIVAIIDGDEYGIDTYGLYDANGKKYSEFTGYKPQVGDTIKVLTVVGKYNNAQLKNPVLVEYNHNYVAVVTPPTCLEQGYTTYTCPCGDSYKDNYTDKVDCNYNGGDVCVNCGVKNHEHTTVAGEVVAPTCTAEGYTVYKCSDADCAFTEKKDATEKLAHVDADGDFECDAGDCDAVVVPAADSVLTIEQAIALGKLFAKNTYTSGKYYVTGTITEVYNASYGNMYITDGTNTLAVYGTYSADGSLRYDKLTVKPAAGDEITVYGIIGFYTAPQMKNGWIQHNNDAVVTEPTCTEGGFTTYTCKYCGTVSTGAETEPLDHNFVNGVCDRCGALDHVHVYTEVVTAPTCYAAGYTTYTCNCGDSYVGNEVAATGAHADNDGDIFCDTEGCTVVFVPAEGATLTIEQAIAVAGTFAHNTYTSGKYYITGTIKEVYNTQYGNMYLTDGTNTITIYGTYSADGAARYDALATKPAAGDVITVYGILGTYSSTAQMKNGWIQHSNDEVVKAPTCTEGGYTTYTCKFCGTVSIGAETEPLDHNFVNGVCDRCGALDHVHVYTEVVTAPTCYAAGYTTYTCNCGDSYVGNEVAATGEHVDGNGDYKCDTTGCTAKLLPEDGATLTIEQALKIGALQAHNTYTTNKYYVTGVITEVYGAQYGNMYVTYGGETITVYGLYKNGTRYDAMTDKPVAGDEITVYGVLGQYNGTPQFKNAELVEFGEHVCSEYTEATCKELAKCVICGTKTGELAEHTYVDGTCSVCGHEEGAAEKVPTSVSKTHNDIASIAGVTAGQTTGIIDGMDIALNDDISIRCDKNTAGTKPTVYSESIRLYQNGALLTITAAEGCEMTTIVIKLASNAAGDGPIQVTGGTASALTNYTYTITVDEGVNEVVIKAIGTDKNSRLYVAGIEVNYKK